MLPRCFWAIALASLVSAKAMWPTHHAFVNTSGTKFQLKGKDFYFAGSNAYYFPFSKNRSDVDVGFRAVKEAGLKVIRTWGFNDKNQTYQPNGFPKYGGEGAGETETVFQSWDNGKSTINLKPFDVVVNAARRHDIKLIVALTNNWRVLEYGNIVLQKLTNWADYRGMDVYTVNLGSPNPYHDDFYRVPVIKDAFKRYVKAMVTRYKNSPAIMAWELANEPRCKGDHDRNLPRSPGDCDSRVLTAWKDEMSSYIKSLDPLHLVTTGGEGQFTRFNPDDVFYNGTDGGDFDAELALPNVDFGTFHSYPDYWTKSVEWTTQWIKDHAASGEKANKPVLHEEYGWLHADDRMKAGKKAAAENETRIAVMELWQSTMLSLKMSDCYWQFGYSNFSYGQNHNDGFTIYLDSAEAQEVVVKHAAKVNALNGEDR